MNFQGKWVNEESMILYKDSITQVITPSNLLPQLYLLRNRDKIIRCAGLIGNNFIRRMKFISLVVRLVY